MARVAACLLFAATTSVSTAAAGTLDWAERPPLPEGLAGVYAGTSGGALIAAGGTHFEEAGAGQRRRKRWRDEVYLLQSPDSAWQKLDARLPRPLAEGASVTLGDGVICIGGDDADRCYTDVFMLRWIGGKLPIETLPPLPAPRALLTAALVDGVVYVAGGIEGAAATESAHTFWAMDLSRTRDEWRWEALDPWPGPGRHLATAAALQGAFYVVGGVQLNATESGGPAWVTPYLRDAYRYIAGRGAEVTAS